MLKIARNITESKIPYIESHSNIYGLYAYVHFYTCVVYE